MRHKALRISCQVRPEVCFNERKLLISPPFSRKKNKISYLNLPEMDPTKLKFQGHRVTRGVNQWLEDKISF